MFCSLSTCSAPISNIYPHPTMCTCLHFCLDPTGSDVECHYKLMRYGIVPSSLPVDGSGNLRQAEFLAYIDWIRTKEVGGQTVTLKTVGTKSTKKRAATPQRVIRGVDIDACDVLLGKGSYHYHPGNVRLSIMVDDSEQEYDSSSKFEKTIISMAIVEKIKKTNARFLKRRNKGVDEWIEVGDLEARRSIIHRFRNKVRNASFAPCYDSGDLCL